MIIDAGLLDWLAPTRMHKLLWLVSKICKAWHLHERTRVGFFVNISIEKLRKKLHWRFAGQVAKILSTLGVVEINTKYSAGNFARSFRLTERYWNDPLKVIEGGLQMIKDESVVENAEQRWVLDSLRAMEFDDVSFRALVAPQMTTTRLLRAERSIDRLKAGIFNLKGGRAQRRITHTVTYCPRELRAFLSINGDRLVSVDIKSSQPVLLLSLYDDPSCEEAERYKETLRAGIYSELASADKATAKEQFGAFISPKYWRKNEFGDNFAERFPALTTRIRSFPGSLAAYLQDVEAEIVIYRLVPKLRERGLPFVSIHDGGLVRPCDAEIVATLLREEVAARVGFVPAVTVVAPPHRLPFFFKQWSGFSSQRAWNGVGRQDVESISHAYGLVEARG